MSTARKEGQIVSEVSKGIRKNENRKLERSRDTIRRY